MAGDKREKPKYEQILDDIIYKIQTGYYQAGDAIPSENEMIETWGVSRTTTAKAMTELFLRGYINRIQGKGSFVQPLGSHIPQQPVHHYGDNGQGGTENHLAQRGRNFLKELPDYTRKVGVIIPQYHDYHSSSIIRGIMNTLRFPEWYVNIALGSEKHLEEFSLNYFLSKNYDGIILFPTDYEFYSDTILEMTLYKYPLVLVDRKFPGIHCMSVTCDNQQACELAVSHLTELGHSRIAFLSSATWQEQVTALRCRSFLGAMQRRGLQGITYESFFSSAQAHQLQDEFFTQLRRGQITAVVASNASSAIRLYKLCEKQGVRIPEDLSLICFDNPNAVDMTFNNFFTYLDQNSPDMGTRAAQLLVRALDEDIQDLSKEEVVLQPRLVLQKSTQRL